MGDVYTTDDSYSFLIVMGILITSRSVLPSLLVYPYYHKDIHSGIHHEI